MLKEFVKNKLSSKMATDVLITFTVQIVIMLCMFATNKILSNKLNVEDFGLYNVARKSIAVISLVMQAGTGIALPRYLALYLGNNNSLRAKAFLSSAILYVLIVSFFICILGFCFREQLLDIVTGSSELSFYYIAFGYAFVMALLALIVAYFRGLSDFKNFNFSQLIIQIALIIPLLVIKELSLEKVFISWIAIIFIVVLYYTISEKLKKRFVNGNISFNSLIEESKILLLYSLPRLVGDFFLLSFSAFPLIYLKENFDLVSTAYYSVGITIVTIATPIFSILGTILLPYVSEAMAQKKMEQVHKYVGKMAIIYVIVAVLITIIFYILMEFLIVIFFSDDYMAAKEISQILILSIVPQSIYLLYRNPIDAVAVFPYNTLLLGLSLVSIIVLFCVSHTLAQFAWNYVIVSVFQGVFSFIVWISLKNKLIKNS